MSVFAVRCAGPQLTDMELRDLMLRSAPQSMVVTDACDPANPIIHANEAFLELTGYTADEVLGKNCSFLSGAETSKHSRAAIKAAIESRKRFKGMVLNYKKGGEPFWNDLMLVPVEHSGRYYYVGAQNDVTDFVQLQENIQEAQKMQALGQLSGGIAHDFNNILALILGNAELLSDTCTDPGEKDSLKEIIDAADSGSELVKRMLQFAGVQAAESQSVDVDHLIRNIAMMVGRSIGEGIRIEVDLTAQHKSVAVDKAMFRTSLINLALNARDAMPEGGVLRFTSRLRQKGPYGAACGIAVTVSDTGTGMTDEVKTRALEPFFTTKAAGRGTGLGLATTYRFVKETGGKMGIETKLGAGSAVTLFLPCEAAPRYPLADGADTIRLLLVEDDPKMRRMLGTQLRQTGFGVDDAASAEEALRLLESEHGYAAVVSDISLGVGLTGIDLAKTVGLSQDRKDLPFLLITGHADQLDHARTHFQDVPVLRKPFRKNDLLSALRDLGVALNEQVAAAI